MLNVHGAFLVLLWSNMFKIIFSVFIDDQIMFKKIKILSCNGNYNILMVYDKKTVLLFVKYIHITVPSSLSLHSI